MKVTITLNRPDDQVEIVRAGCAGLQRLDVALSADGRFAITTHNAVEVPTLGALEHGALTHNIVQPILIGDFTDPG